MRGSRCEPMDLFDAVTAEAKSATNESAFVTSTALELTPPVSHHHSVVFSDVFAPFQSYARALL